MMRRLALVLLLAPVLASPAVAGIFFNKKAEKPNPAVVVPDLIRTIQSDGDEDKRVAAAEQLREFDPTQFPDVVPTLIGALQNDRKPSVRAEAALSLGKIRPVSDKVGVALEQALAKDASMRVRLQARSVLLQYRWSGWKEPVVKKDEIPTARPQGAAPTQSKEPPLAAPPAKAPLAQTSDRAIPKAPLAPQVLQTPMSVPLAPPAPEPTAAPLAPPTPEPSAGDEQGPVLNPPPE